MRELYDRSLDEKRLDEDILSLLDALEKVRLGDCAAYNLSSAMHRVELHLNKRSQSQIDQAACKRLSQAVVQARVAAERHLPATYTREKIIDGMQAFAFQVTLWAEDPERRARRDCLIDVSIEARMFRNDLHNMSLAELKEERLLERRNGTGDDFGKIKVEWLLF